MADIVQQKLSELQNQVKDVKLQKPNISKSDGMAAITTGIANVPDGMASAVLAGVNPVHGVYTLIVGTPLASLTLSTKLMMFNTTSAMTLVAVDGLGDRNGDERIKALLVIALIAGTVQLALGILGLGMLTKFVPNAVMVGFLTGIAVSIILGQLWDFFGYSDDEGGSRLQKTARLLQNLGEIDWWTSAVGVGTLVIMIILGTGPLSNFNLLIGLAAATAVVWIADPGSVLLVSSWERFPVRCHLFSFPVCGSRPICSCRPSP